MNKLMYRFVATRKKKKKRKKKKRNRPVFRHGMPLQGIPRKKKKRNRPVFRHGMPPQGIPRNKNTQLLPQTDSADGVNGCLFKCRRESGCDRMEDFKLICVGKSENKLNTRHSSSRPVI